MRNGRKRERKNEKRTEKELQEHKEIMKDKIAGIYECNGSPLLRYHMIKKS